MSDYLVSVKKYNQKLVELPIKKRIETQYPILIRDEVSKKLAKVSFKLPKNLKLQINGGYRSRKTQEKIWNYRLKQFKNYKNTRKLVFDPKEGIPPHSTGGAVDIGLFNIKTNREINLSNPFQKFYEEANPFSKKISRESHKQRMLIRKLMLNENFAPNPREYWHFSYGDKAWADFYKKKILYSEIYEEEISNLKYNLLKRFVIKIHRKIFQLINKIFKLDLSY